MEKETLLRQLLTHPQVKSLADVCCKESAKRMFVSGLCASSAPLYFSSLALGKKKQPPFLFVLNDMDEAGYFYHDMVQMLGEESVLFFPSSYRRAIKYNQKDAANAILRTEVLSRLSSYASNDAQPLYIVTYPEALAEKVVSKNELSDNMVRIAVGAVVDVTELEKRFFELGFRRTDYVYEPGQFAIRGSIVDIFSYSSENPFRIDFFGDEVDSIRTFDVQSQLSQGKVGNADIVPEINRKETDYVPFTDFVPGNLLLVVRDLAFMCDRVAMIYEEGFSAQALAEEKANHDMMRQKGEEVESTFSDLYDGSMNSALKIREHTIVSSEEFNRGITKLRRIELGNSLADTEGYVVRFDISQQPLFHKNFDLLSDELRRLIGEGYRINILADSDKQITRLKDIFAEINVTYKELRSKELGSEGSCEIRFEAVNRAIHSGFIDHTTRQCFFTDHQIFDRFHKYNLKSEKARRGKVALTLKPRAPSPPPRSRACPRWRCPSSRTFRLLERCSPR